MDDHKELAENHKRIWLAPLCEVDERTWCQDDQGSCEECELEWIEYVRADLAKAEIEKLRAALKVARVMVRDEPIAYALYSNGRTLIQVLDLALGLEQKADKS